MDSRALIIGPIRQEILSGIKDEAQFEKLKNSLQPFDDNPISPMEYELAARLNNQCRSKGIQGSHIDFLICAVAINNSMEYQYKIESQECINSGFEPGEDNLDKWVVFNANFDPFVWDLDYISPIISNTGNNAAIYQYNLSGTVAADDWLFSPCIKPTSDLYNLSFYMKTGENEGTVYPEKLAVWIGNYPNPDSMKTKLWENDSLIALGYQNVTVPVQTESSLIQYVGFHVHSNPNMYYVAIDDVNFCIPESIEEINTSNINIYPNPASESISIYSDLSNYSVELFDVSQRKLLTIDNSPKTVNVKNLSSGIYFVKIYSDKNTFFEKLIIR